MLDASRPYWCEEALESLLAGDDRVQQVAAPLRFRRAGCRLARGHGTLVARETLEERLIARTRIALAAATAVALALG
ncbi:MAG TPA: hypothetical protein VJK66_00555, partial [Gaiellaceae bacterium]|nr:hypothetical protein [Gaiellaceae bacterium]